VPGAGDASIPPGKGVVGLHQIGRTNFRAGFQAPFFQSMSSRAISPQNGRHARGTWRTRLEAKKFGPKYLPLPFFDLRTLKFD